ncbi:MAG: cobalamin-binding protein [Herminiimonas sp.]|nr:cobalamin-binding protein [Herminiimonas sp.]
MQDSGTQTFAGRWVILAILTTLATPASAAGPSVTDDAGHVIHLATPAQRIISLAPHATELLFAAGAGERIVGVSQFSNYPPQAARIASVGGAMSLDLERIVSLKPDLVVGWGSGSSASQLERLRALGIVVFDSEPRDFEAIASSMERFGVMAGTEATAASAARRFRDEMAALRTTYAARTPVRVFFQVWQAPLMTLNDAHLVSAALHLCGATNIFGSLPQLAPTVSVEAVLSANPDVLVTSGDEQSDALKAWRRFPSMTAVARGNLVQLPADTMTRAGPRIADATRMLCTKLDAARLRLR